MSKVLVIANHEKSRVREALGDFLPWLEERADIVDEVDAYDQCAIEDKKADFGLIFGGDGTLLGLARKIVDLQLPLVGINFGKLGFLAPFSLSEIQEYWDEIDAMKFPIIDRVMLEATIRNKDGETQFTSLATNDVVITAGPPYRMIDMEMTIDNAHAQPMGTHFSGDGVIISTPTGSTAYNLSAGGPVIAPGVDAIVINPICPHTLSFRPIVVHASDKIIMRLHRCNEGTNLVIDGQIPYPMQTGDILEVRTYATRLRVVANPHQGYWKTLARKMHWAARPRFEN